MTIENFNLNDVAQEAVSVTTEELSKIVQQALNSDLAVTIDQVMQSLDVFEKEYFKYYELIKVKRSLKKKGQDMGAIRQEIHTMERDLYEKFFNFQNLFNAYYGQKIVMTYVYRNENGEFQIGLSDNDLSHVVENQFQHLEYSVEGIEEMLKLEAKEYDNALLDETANSIYDRWEIAKARFRKGTGLPIFWQNDDGSWVGMKINNRGTIAEAYANFYINKVPFTGIGGIERRVGFYITDKENGVMGVDNTLGFFLGDVTASNEQSVQYAVKTQRAGLMGMYQINKYIQQIKKDLKSANGPEFLEALKEKVSQPGKIKQVTSNLSKFLEKDLNNLLKDYEDKKIGIEIQV